MNVTDAKRAIWLARLYTALTAVALLANGAIAGLALATHHWFDAVAAAIWALSIAVIWITTHQMRRDNEKFLETLREATAAFRRESDRVGGDPSKEYANQ